MKKHQLSALFGIALLATATSAQAASRTVFISGSDLAISGPPATASAIGIGLPDAASSSLFINLTLPKGFKPNSTAKLQLRMIGGGASCNVALAVSGGIRIRPGLPIAILVGPGSGMTFVGSGTVTTPAAALQAFTKTILVAPAAGGTVLGQKTGDTVAVVVNRDGAGAADTCAGGMTVTSAKFTYKVP